MARSPLTDIELDAYLQRIQWGDRVPLQPSLEVLARLMRLHQLAIPFENASMHVPALKAPISIDSAAVFSKLVASGRRGGWCFEQACRRAAPLPGRKECTQRGLQVHVEHAALPQQARPQRALAPPRRPHRRPHAAAPAAQNGLFSAVLRTLGYDVVDGAARVAAPDPAAPGRMRLGPHLHQVLFVSLGGQRWLVDVGFGGDQLPLPLLLPADSEQHLAPAAGAAWPYADADGWAGRLPGDGHAALALQRRFSVRPGLPDAVGEAVDPAAVPHWGLRGGYFLRKAPRTGGEPRDILWFRLEEHLPQDYELANQCVQMLHPYFTANLVVARQLPCGGRVTLLNDQLRFYDGGEADGDSSPREERQLGGPDEVAAALAEHFGIHAGSG